MGLVGVKLSVYFGHTLLNLWMTGKFSAVFILWFFTLFVLIENIYFISFSNFRNLLADIWSKHIFLQALSYHGWNCTCMHQHMLKTSETYYITHTLHYKNVFLACSMSKFRSFPNVNITK